MGRKALDESEKVVQIYVYVKQSTLKALGGKEGIGKICHSAIKRAHKKKVKDDLKAELMKKFKKEVSEDLDHVIGKSKNKTD